MTERLTDEARHADTERNRVLNTALTDLDSIINGHDPEVDTSINNMVWDRLEKMAVEIEALAHRRATPADDLRALTTVADAMDQWVQVLRDGRDPSISVAGLRDMASIVRRAALSHPEPPREPAIQMPRAWLDVMGERTRQMAVEGWTPDHDDKHDQAQMAGAALCYLAEDIPHWARSQAQGCYWPWDAEWWKPADPRRNLVKAGALILAEIERLDRTALSQPGGAA